MGWGGENGERGVCSGARRVGRVEWGVESGEWGFGSMEMRAGSVERCGDRGV